MLDDAFPKLPALYYYYTRRNSLQSAICKTADILGFLDSVGDYPLFKISLVETIRI